MTSSSTHVSRRGDNFDGSNGRYKVIGEYPGAFIRGLDRNLHWIGQRCMLYIPVDGEPYGNEQRYERVEMQGCEVHIMDRAFEVCGFVHVNPSTGEPIRYVQDDHTGLYRREWWMQRTEG